MNGPNIFYDLPIAAAGLVFVAVLLVALETGYRVALVKRHRLPNPEAGGGGIVLTSMFSLLGLMLAFTYGFTVNRYDQRRLAAIAEANALGTAFLRAGLIGSPAAAALRGAIYDYARTRVVDQDVKDQADDVVRHSLDAQARLWPLTEQIVNSKLSGPIEALLVASVNEVLDLHTNRLAAVFDRLPPPVFWMLVVVAAASISVAGFNAGLVGFISRWRMSALTIVLAVIMLLIIDFDRPRDGFIQVSQEPLRLAAADMESKLTNREQMNPVIP